MRKEEILNNIKVSPHISIKEALKKISEVAWRALFVCDENGTLIGSLSDGDIRRRILQKGDFQESIEFCFNRNPNFIVAGGNVAEEARKIMVEKTIDVLPVVDKQKRIVDVLHWKEMLKERAISRKGLDIPIVIMAGGRGERLDPFTKILPKPLIPIGEKPMIEIIIDKFRQHGANHFYFTLNYKGEMIKTYFDSIEKDYRIDYIWEKDFLGTAGSLRLLPADLGDTFIVSNCDIIVDLDFEDLIRLHRKNSNILTVVGSIQHYRIPYGIIQFEKEGKIKEIQEKPEFVFTVNAGVYVLSKAALSHIPENRRLDMTDFIKSLLGKRESVGVYPVGQKSYIDIGQWEEYKKHTEKLI